MRSYGNSQGMARAPDQKFETPEEPTTVDCDDEEDSAMSLCCVMKEHVKLPLAGKGIREEVVEQGRGREEMRDGTHPHSSGMGASTRPVSTTCGLGGGPKRPNRGTRTSDSTTSGGRASSANLRGGRAPGTL